jgi:hypothetical protein
VAPALGVIIRAPFLRIDDEGTNFLHSVPREDRRDPRLNTQEERHGQDLASKAGDRTIFWNPIIASIRIFIIAKQRPFVPLPHPIVGVAGVKGEERFPVPLARSLPL